MALVNYSDSDSDSASTLPKQKNDGTQPGSATRKRKLSSSPEKKITLPPLPQSFRDLYSSTVRTSTVDDPALHGGRKRVIPHVQGNWPAHVYLEWTPSPEEYSLLGSIIDAHQQAQPLQPITSLLQTPLCVPLPLHISLSRPLTLSTPQKDPFLASLTSSLHKSGVKGFNVVPKGVSWHGNEEGTRWFLVLKVVSAEGRGELGKLLESCNDVCAGTGLAELYTESHASKRDTGGNGKSKADGQEVGGEAKMHISVAWSLSPPPVDADATESAGGGRLPDGVRGLHIPFREVKVRIGQDVSSVSLGAARGNTKGEMKKMS